VWLRGSNNVDAEFSQIEEVVVAMQHSDSQRRDLSVTNRLLSLSELVTSPQVFKPLLLSLALMFFQQASGVNAVIFYTSQIFASAGFSSNPNTPTMIVGAVLVAATLLSVIVADIAGRRLLLLTSGSVMTASIAALGLYFFVTEKYQVLDVCLSVCLFVPRLFL